MELSLQGRRALVTGSTAGIGLAVARGLAGLGASVVVNGRTRERVHEAVEAVSQAVPGADVSGVAADLGDAKGVARLVGAIPDADILVNNLGIFEPRAFEEISDADWQRMFETNVMSGVRLSRHHFPRMKARGWGRVVFVSSESAVQIPAEMIHYGVTKTAQVALARGMAETTVGTGVTVNSVLVGPTRSEGVGTFVERLARERGVSAAEQERDFFHDARPTSLLKRFITVDEAASMIVYVCTPAAAATNGSALRVDGGVVRAVL